MAQPVIRSVTFDSTDLAPGQTVTGVVDAFDPDARVARLRAQVGDASVVTVLTVGDPLPDPVFDLVDDQGQPVTDPTFTVVADPQDPFTVHVTALDVPDA